MQYVTSQVHTPTAPPLSLYVGVRACQVYVCMAHVHTVHPHTSHKPLYPATLPPYPTTTLRAFHGRI